MSIIFIIIASCVITGILICFTFLILNDITFIVIIWSLDHDIRFYKQYTYNQMMYSFWVNRKLWREVWNRYKLSKSSNEINN